VSESREDSRRRCLALGFDRNESSRHAVAWALADLLPDGKLVLVHACRPLNAPPSPLLGAHERMELGRAVIDELLLEADDELRDLELAVEVIDSDPVSALVQAAERHDADAIVLGSERHSRLHKALGVVTAELLDVSPVPVIAVPAGARSPRRASRLHGSV
jgi:nucleotide-binding universal stress UspA family protein